MEATEERREFRVENEHRYDTRTPVRWITSHTARYPVLPLLMLAAAVVNNFAYSYIQVFVGRAMDVISSSGWAVSALIGAALGVFGATGVQAVTAIVRNFSVEFLAQRIERDARQELYISLLGKSQTFHGRQRIGDIMARSTNDVHMLNQMFSPGISLTIDSALALIVPLIVIATVNVRLLLVPVIFTALLLATVVEFTRRIQPVSMAQRTTFGEMNSELAEAVGGIEVVKAHAREQHEWLKFAQKAREYRNLFIKQARIQGGYLPTLVFSIAWAAAVFHAMILWRSHVISIGQVVTYIGLVGTLRYTTYMSLFTLSLVQLGVASAERVLQLINARTDLDENPAGVKAVLRGDVRFDRVSFAYEGRTILRDIDFRADSGETIAIVGHTGSGKTTLTRLINRIFDADQGRILVDGVDVRSWSLESLRSQISAIEQDVFLFSRSVYENIAFGVAGATRAAVETAAREAQAHEFVLELPDGYDTVIGERGVTLSGGQRQRLAIARAFLTDPKILILDDSTSAIDSATEDQIQKAMRRIAERRTTFIITHRLSQIRWADRILVLGRGTIADQGKHEELLERSPEYRRIFARYD